MEDEGPFAGVWSYRSFYNDPDLGTAFEDLAFGVGTRTLLQLWFGRLEGTLGGAGWNLDLVGQYAYGAPCSARFQGRGEIGGELWVYDYIGFLTPNWTNGTEQRPAVVGPLVRTAAHSNGQARAGYVASFVAVRQP